MAGGNRGMALRRRNAFPAGRGLRFRVVWPFRRWSRRGRKSEGRGSEGHDGTAGAGFAVWGGLGAVVRFPGLAAWFWRTAEVRSTRTRTVWEHAVAFCAAKSVSPCGGHHPKRRPQTRRSSEAAPQQDRAPWGGAGTRAAISSPTPPTGYPCGVRPGRPDTAPRHRAVSRASPSKSSGRSR